MPSTRPRLPRLADVTTQETALVTALCRVIEQAEHAPSLTQLAAHAGLSTHQLHRLFRRLTGVTPKAYADAHRARRMQDGLHTDATVSAVAYDAGFGASSRFYAATPARLGMTPTRYRAGGAGERIRFAVGACTLGALLVAASDKGLCAIWLDDTPAPLVQQLQDRFANAELIGGDVAFEQWMAQVVGFLDDPTRGLDLPLDIRGTAFQQRVWDALRRIPPGQTLSYTELAARIEAPSATRAVASACAANTLAVAIPCHRIVRQDGSLSGYRWGVARKRALLAREAHGDAAQADGRAR